MQSQRYSDGVLSNMALQSTGRKCVCSGDHKRIDRNETHASAEQRAIKKHELRACGYSDHDQNRSMAASNVVERANKHFIRRSSDIHIKLCMRF